MKNFSKLVNATGAKTIQGVLKTLGKLGIAFEAGLIATEATARMGMGDTFSESIKYSLDYLVPADRDWETDGNRCKRVSHRRRLKPPSALITSDFIPTSDTFYKYTSKHKHSQAQ